MTMIKCLKEREMSEHSLQIIAQIHNDFPEKFGVPHQSGWLKEQDRKSVV